MARPRSEAAHQAALAATVDILVGDGVEGVTFEEVAARTGVARSTLYRHFGSKEELVARAAGLCSFQVATPDTGNLETDLRTLFQSYQEAEDARRLPDLLPLLLDEAPRSPEINDLVQRMAEERRRPLRTILRLAQARGEVDAGLDLETALAFLIGPFSYRRMIDRQAVTPEFRDTVLVLALRALGVPKQALTT